MTHILAIDPGHTQSALVIYQPDKRLVQVAVKEANDSILSRLREYQKTPDLRLCIEMIASYGMPVGAEVFETCVWIGRFMQAWGKPCDRLFRTRIKIVLCGKTTAKDSHIRQRLIDLFGPTKEKAIGLKKTPGPLYGLKADMWAALAVAVVSSEQQEK